MFGLGCHLCPSVTPRLIGGCPLLFVCRYTPQNVELDYHFKPFIPDYIPSIGDVDAFLKVCVMVWRVRLLMVLWFVICCCSVHWEVCCDHLYIYTYN